MLLLGGACAVLLLMPWHGPIILSLSWSHGIHAGDLAALPLFALAVGYLQANDGWRAARWPAGRWAVSAYAVLLGALLVLRGRRRQVDQQLQRGAAVTSWRRGV